MIQRQLGIWERAVFVDWHGVLSSDPFWRTILDRRGRLPTMLRQELGRIFGGDSGISDLWMRGTVSTSELMRPLASSLHGNMKPDFLERRMLNDCQEMVVDEHLAALFTESQRRCWVVLATDNVADFETAFRLSKRTPGSAGSTRRLRDTATAFDDILCSGRIGVLKSEDPYAFFGPWLEDRGLAFADALLVDDRADNCEAFERAGGASVLWPLAPDDRGAALDIVRQFVAPPHQEPRFT